MEYKFKKGDKVVAMEEGSLGNVKKGWIGTVDENSVTPFVNWDNLARIPIHENKLKLYKPAPQVKIAVSFENDSEKIAYLRYCESIGKRLATCGIKGYLGEDEYVIGFHNIVDIYEGVIAQGQESWFKERGYSIVPFKVFAALKGIDYTPVVEVKLNKEYTATIENGKVKVGGQTFEFDRIEALYNAVKEATK